MRDLFAAHCVWWLDSRIGQKYGLVNHIDNLQLLCKNNPETELCIINPGCSDRGSDGENCTDNRVDAANYCETYLTES